MYRKRKDDLTGIDLLLIDQGSVDFIEIVVFLQKFLVFVSSSIENGLSRSVRLFHFSSSACLVTLAFLPAHTQLFMVGRQLSQCRSKSLGFVVTL